MMLTEEEEKTLDLLLLAKVKAYCEHEASIGLPAF